MQNKWGIYEGFTPRIHPLNKWEEPTCVCCGNDLKAWIDWWISSSIGYCDNCNIFYVVKTTWRPSPDAHIRSEINELVGHKIQEVSTKGLNVNINDLIDYHENIPIDTHGVDFLFKKVHELKDYNTQESGLFQHLIWSLIFNSISFDGSLIKEYVDFVFENPHYYKMYDKYEIWIGHEISIARRLERDFYVEMTKSVYDIWLKFNKDFEEYHFKSRIGFYVPLENEELIKYGQEFYDFALRIRQRI